MKKVLMSLFLFLVFPVMVNAEVKTITRTRDNLHVNKPEIVVTEDNIQNILNTPYVDASEKIYDFANVLTEDEKDDLYTRIMDFVNEYNMDMVIVTIDEEFNDYQVETFADDFFDYNNFGEYTSGTSYDGILVIRNVNDFNRYYYISNSGMAQLYFSGSRTDQILDNMYDNMHIDNYYAGFIDFINETRHIRSLGLPEKYEGCHVDNYGNLYDENGNKINFARGRYILPLFPAFITAIITSLIIILILIGKNKMVKKAVQASEYINKDSVEILKREDNFLSSHTTHYTVSSSSSGGGSHSGSSGFSHSGGGRHC